MRRGPNVVVNGRELGTIALVYELDADLGATFELLVLDEDTLLENIDPWPQPSEAQAVKDRQSMAIWLSLAIVLLVVLSQFAVQRLHQSPAPLITKGPVQASDVTIESTLPTMQAQCVRVCTLPSILLSDSAHTLLQF